MALDDFTAFNIEELIDALKSAVDFHNALFQQVVSASNKTQSWEELNKWLEALFNDGIAESRKSDLLRAIKKGQTLLLQSEVAG